MPKIAFIQITKLFAKNNFLKMFGQKYILFEVGLQLLSTLWSIAFFSSSSSSFPFFPCECVCVCVRACMRACVRVRVCVCVPKGCLRWLLSYRKEKWSVDKVYFTMAMSRRTIWSEHSNCKDVGISSRTRVLGDIYFMNFNTFSLVINSQIRLCEGGRTTWLSTGSGIWRTLLQKSPKRPADVDQWGRKKAARWM